VEVMKKKHQQTTGDEPVAGVPHPGIVSVESVQAWIDAQISPLTAEYVLLGAATGRVVHVDCRTDMPIPEYDRAVLDGFAIQAAQSVGASAYNPLSVPGIAVALGDALPLGSDAVVPVGTVDIDTNGNILLVDAVAPGVNVEPEGAAAPVGGIVVPAGTRLAARHIGALAAAGVAGVALIKVPRVAVLIVEPSHTGKILDSNSPMIRAAVERDGGIVVVLRSMSRDPPSLKDAIAAADADLVLLIGGTGPGPNDHAAAALSGAGELLFHGVAMRPGETFGLGRSPNFRPVMLLPGAPAACHWSYEMFAGRAIRTLAGRHRDLPFHARTMVLARKIVSAIGLTEICPVRFSTPENTVESLRGFAAVRLAAPVGADGFIVVPEGSEGYAQGAAVVVRLYEADSHETMAPS
jgi:molybdopterin molybdotransferase